MGQGSGEEEEGGTLLYTQTQWPGGVAKNFLLCCRISRMRQPGSVQRIPRGSSRVGGTVAPQTEPPLPPTRTRKHKVELNSAALPGTPASGLFRHRHCCQPESAAMESEQSCHTSRRCLSGKHTHDGDGTLPSSWTLTSSWLFSPAVPPRIRASAPPRAKNWSLKIMFL